MPNKLLLLALVVLTVTGGLHCAPRSLHEQQDPVLEIAPADVHPPVRVARSPTEPTMDPTQHDLDRSTSSPSPVTRGFGEAYCLGMCPSLCAGQDWCCAALECSIGGHTIGLGSCHCLNSGSYHVCMVCNKRRR